MEFISIDADGITSVFDITLPEPAVTERRDSTVAKETRQARWLVVFSAALALQALSASDYALYFAVLLWIWTLWFIRPRMWREAVAIAVAGAASVVAVSPIILGYARIHDGHNLSRDFAEVLAYSADITSLVTAPPMSANPNAALANHRSCSVALADSSMKLAATSL